MMNNVSFDSSTFQKAVNLAHLSLSLGIKFNEKNSGVYCSGKWSGKGELFYSTNPSNGEKLADIIGCDEDDYDEVIAASMQSSASWRMFTAPKRGEVLLEIRRRLVEKKNDLAILITLEMGKILDESLGEVQEFIDICDYAIGLSRMLNGQIIPSERSGHVILETWNPLGVVGVISAFNFPMAVFGWNCVIALVTGNTVVWKPSPTTSLCAIAIIKIISQIFEGIDMPNVCTLVCGDAKIGSYMSRDTRINLLSFTGSTSVGKIVGVAVQERFGKSLLELGGNNAIIVLSDSDVNLAVRSVLFAAVGTCGQRCTTARRLLLHEDVYDNFLATLTHAYSQIKIGFPWENGVLCGPLHSKMAVKIYLDVIDKIKRKGGEIIVGGHVIRENFVEPTIAIVKKKSDLTKVEHFVPVLFVTKISSLEEGIELNNEATQGLSSALFSNNIKNIFKWIGPEGSDCGIVNVNIPTNGAEIGGAFGGEKDTGGGRESGSNAWQQYMRRATCTINYSGKLPLAQGIKFD